uniref:F-actin monooxygenase n=1 Tax=Oryzias latipes TaxID=8090 RepID=A0A3P9KLR2_ORYLA
MGDGGACAGGGVGVNKSHALFDNFVQASTCKGTLKAFQELCEHLEVKPTEHRVFYHKLKSKLNYWKAKALWTKLDKRASQKEYKKGRACANTKCLIIGAGPCGLRTAIELAFLGARVVLLEKRDAFSRNNVLHLWPFTIQDLRGLGAKKFYGKFCAGAIDHISIRQLQLILLKVALLLGIEIHVNIEFKGLIEPPEDQEGERIGWRAEVHPRTHPVSELEFDVIIGADGRRNTLPGFRRKEFRGKLAIAITANFINRNTTAEAKVEEISGVAFIFNQKFFQDLREATGIDLENIVYYKDDTHYFVMTAKKQSLLEKGVILHDYADTELLLSRANVDQAALLSYAREAADFSTNHQLPTLDFAINHYGQPDVAMFDFTCMYASENAAMVRQRNGHRLLVALVGDSLLEPFWPMGTGIARGFLAAMDSAWMARSWAQGKSPLEVLAERESIYRLLPQTTPENVSKNFSHYSLDPTTRYPNVSLNFLKPSQVRHLVNTGEEIPREIHIEIENVINSSTPKLARNESIARSSKLLNWCQRQTEGYKNVSVKDLTMSWKSGLALCALIHRYRPDLIDFDSLDERDQERNNQLAFDVAEKEFGICPCMTGKEMSSVVEPDKLSMVMYLSQFYEMFKDTVPPGDNQNLSPEERAALVATTKSPISFFSKLGQSIAISRKRNPKDKKEKEADGSGKRRKTSQSEDEDACRPAHDERPPVPAGLSERRIDSSAGGNNNNKVKVMATQLLAKFEENAPAQPAGLKRQGSLRKEFPANIGGSDVCFFCRKRVYVMERLSAEGKFFHRSCFQCDYCGTTLRLSSYAFDVEDGKFYCKPHYCYRLSGYAQRKRPAPSPAPAPAKTPQSATMATDAPGRATTAVAPSAELQTSAPEVNGLQEPSLAKKLRGTPERIELENYRLSLQREEELEEVPEETLAEHNLSSVLDKATDADLGSSSSESDMEEEDEQEEAEEGPPDPSDLGGVPWKEAVELYAKLRGEESEGEALVDAISRDGDVDEEEEDVEEEEDEEEDEETSDEPCEDEELEAEAESPDIEPCTELDQGTSSDQNRHQSEVYRGNLGKPWDQIGLLPPPAPAPRPPLDVAASPVNVPNSSSSPPASAAMPPVASAVKPADVRPAARTPGTSAICSQPTSLPESRASISPVYPHRSICPLTGNPLSPICAQPLSCHEPSSPLSAGSPVRTQPVPALASTPATAADKSESFRSSDSSSEETPSKRADIIEEFWMKSAEIRKSLGLTPLDRSSKIFDSSAENTPPQDPAPSKPQPSPVCAGQKPASGGRTVIRRLNITLEGQVITPIAPAETRKEVRSGVNGSTAQTANSYNTSDSIMLTPPSSPPPPVPANQSPAVLRQQRNQVSWSNGTKKRPPESAKEALHRSPVPTPTPAPRKAPSPQTEAPPVVVMREKKKPRQELTRKSFVETVEEIPFADDVEEAFDERTLHHAPASSRPSKPPLHLALAMENGKPSVPANPVSRPQRATQFSAEAKEIAEERIKAREKSVKSQALKEAMAKQLDKMKEAETEKGASPKVAWGATPDSTGKSKKSQKNPEPQKAETVPERFFSSNKSLDSSVTSSESSSASKSKKRSSLFSPRKNKKEKKAKNDGSRLSGTDETPPKHKSLWKAVFSGYKKDKKKKDNKSCPSTPSSSSTTQDSGKKRVSPLSRSSDLKAGRNLSVSEDSDLSCDDVLERSSQKSKADSVYVPHALAFKRSYATKKTYTEEELNAKLTRRVQKAARRQAKQEELKRLHRAQIIQRQLEQVEEKQRQLEERGVAVEKALRGEADYWGDSNYSEILDLHLGGMGKKDDPKLMQEWFKLVQEKNALVRYESELMIFARELELEDRQSRLQQELRERMAVEDHLKSEKELAEEKQILNEMLEVVEQRDALVALLEEQRLREKEEDKDLEAVMLSKGFNLNWA